MYHLFGTHFLLAPPMVCHSIWPTTQDHSVSELNRKSDQSQVQNLGQETPKKASHVKQENKTGDPKNSAKMNTVKDSNLRSEDEFIKSMGNETSEWAQVS